MLWYSNDDDDDWLLTHDALAARGDVRRLDASGILATSEKARISQSRHFAFALYGTVEYIQRKLVISLSTYS